MARHTQWCALLDIGSQEITSANGLELGEALEQALGLGAFTDTGRTDNEDAGGTVQTHCRWRRHE